MPNGRKEIKRKETLLSNNINKVGNNILKRMNIHTYSGQLNR